MKNIKLIITTGFAIFSMFFGSGNLIFPLLIGQKVLNPVYGMIGVVITGILLPFLGVITVIYFLIKKKYFFINDIGSIPSLILQLSMLSIMGPLGIIPRCILVSYGGFKLLYPNMNLIVFGILFCAVLFFMSLKNEIIIKIIGKVLTPLLLMGLFSIIYMSLLKKNIYNFFINIPQHTFIDIESFNYGIKTGYQTMDLLASFFFATYIIEYIKKKIKHNNLLRISIISCIFGGTLLALIYISFVYLGALYKTYLMQFKTEQFFTAISAILLGKYSLLIASCLIAISCITTSIALLDLFINFIYQKIFYKIIKNNVNKKLILIISLIISFFMSLFGFNKLGEWIQNILWIFYPALIILTLIKFNEIIFNIKKNNNIGYIFFWMTVLITIVNFLLKKLFH